MLKETIKKIPFANTISKIVYDEWREIKRQKQVRNFLSGDLPYKTECPARFSVGHEPTIRCNLKCQMCYQAKTRGLRQSEINTQDILKVYEKLEGKVNEIKLVGGEPFMRSDIFELIKFWNERGTRVSLQTNLTLVGESAIEKLKQFKNIKAFLTSLDGPEHIHNMVRGVPNAFEKMTAAVKLIHQKMPGVEVSIFCTMLFDTNFESLYQVIDIAKNLNIGSVQFLFEQVNRTSDVINSQKILKNKLGWQENDYRINTQTREELFKENDLQKIKTDLDKLQKYGAKNKCFANLTPYNFYKNLDVYLGQKEKRIFCSKLLNPELRLVQTGDVVWCDIIEKSFGNLLEKSVSEIWLSPDYQNFRQFLKAGSPPICRRCCKAVYI